MPFGSLTVGAAFLVFLKEHFIWQITSPVSNSYQSLDVFIHLLSAAPGQLQSWEVTSNAFQDLCISSWTTLVKGRYWISPMVNEKHMKVSYSTTL